ncbi:MAG TPA: hypothetical protein VGO47_09805, partial [Chlamydiales bacterium]|nr:hypothetical protein [Chlamydiales bacterium]
ITTATHASKEHNPFTNSSSKVPEGISIGTVVAIGAATIIAFHAIGIIAQLIATPIILGIVLGVSVHIALNGPKESLECAKELIKKIPDVTMKLIKNAPAMMERMGATTLHFAKTSLQYIGSKVNPPSKKPYTIGEVAHGIAREGATLAVEAHKKATPVILKTAKSGVEVVRNKIVKGVEYATEKLATMKNREEE